MISGKDKKLAKVQNGIPTREEVCMAGYNACSWAAYDSGGDVGTCYAGYVACMGGSAI